MNIRKQRPPANISERSKNWNGNKWAWPKEKLYTRTIYDWIAKTICYAPLLVFTWFYFLRYVLVTLDVSYSLLFLLFISIRLNFFFLLIRFRFECFVLCVHCDPFFFVSDTQYRMEYFFSLRTHFERSIWLFFEAFRSVEPKFTFHSVPIHSFSIRLLLHIIAYISFHTDSIKYFVIVNKAERINEYRCSMFNRKWWYTNGGQWFAKQIVAL